MSQRTHYWVETPEGGVRPATLEEFAALYESPEGQASRRVGLDGEGGVEVSTVFLGIDHGFSGDPNAAPVLYETMLFGLSGDEEAQERYCTREQAAAGHAEFCRRFLGRGPAPK